MIELARQFRDCYGLTDRAMKQAARELLLAQSSDWAFIMKTGTMVPYAVKRTQDHILRFTGSTSRSRATRSTPISSATASGATIFSRISTGATTFDGSRCLS